MKQPINRREFVVSAAVLGGAVACGSPPRTTPQPLLAPEPPKPLDPAALVPAPERLQRDFDALVQWMSETGWSDYLKRMTGLDMIRERDSLDAELLRLLRVPKAEGFDDFGGARAIEPGKPAKSLIYHALASPRVRPHGGDRARYPSVSQLDALENYIYARAKAVPIGDDNVVAVFAYEYRPAVMTPHGAHADLVFSRTGLARVGSQAMVYDPLHRAFVSAPADPTRAKEAAVTPARYGVFLARRVREREIHQDFRESEDENRYFLLPVRKLFDGDLLIGGGRIAFTESHLNEKLARLARATHHGIRLPESARFDLGRAPFTRRSRSATEPGLFQSAPGDDRTLVALTQQGSSVLLASVPQVLTREAEQDGKPARFLVPPLWHARWSKEVSNRRYSSLKLVDRRGLDVWDLLWSELIRRNATITGIRSPRDVPMFINIRHERDEHTGAFVGHLGARDDFMRKLNEGNYWAGMFEDPICDGCVHAVIRDARAGAPLASAPILAAFSIVTAPDLFPLVDGVDLVEYDDQFLEGGTEQMGGGRLPANPNITLPTTGLPAFANVPSRSPEGWAVDTVTAVITERAARSRRLPALGQRDYVSTNSLPDTASNVFIPGWEATYSRGTQDGAADWKFFATFGLGAPFPEDVKLCAAANGMWPGSSPDAARTYQGALEPIRTRHGSRRPPTAVPLLDHEVGFHARSAAVRELGLSESLGWDAEQGPFLELAQVGESGTSKVAVNAADILRADYVDNAMNPGFDMSLLRELSSTQLIRRMEALRRCVGAIDGVEASGYTTLWLVSAESVPEWRAGARGIGVPAALVGGDRRVATTSKFAMPGAGFLYVFVRAGERAERDGAKRLRFSCEETYVCQILGQRVVWFPVDTQAPRAPQPHEWRWYNG